MSLPKVIDLYYRAEEKRKKITEDYRDYCEKNRAAVYELVRRIKQKKRDDSVAVLVSGISGSTKTFFSELLCSLSDQYVAVHLDCFAVPKERRSQKSTFLAQNFDFQSCTQTLERLLINGAADFPL